MSEPREPITVPDLYRQVQDLTDRLAKQRRVVMCGPGLEVVVRAMINAQGLDGLLKVKTTSWLPKNKIVVIDPNVHTIYLELWNE